LRSGCAERETTVTFAARSPSGAARTAAASPPLRGTTTSTRPSSSVAAVSSRLVPRPRACTEAAGRVATVRARSAAVERQSGCTGGGVGPAVMGLPVGLDIME
jgi:hypothetical protein